MSTVSLRSPTSDPLLIASTKDPDSAPCPLPRSGLSGSASSASLPQAHLLSLVPPAQPGPKDVALPGSQSVGWTVPGGKRSRGRRRLSAGNRDSLGSLRPTRGRKHGA